MSLPIGPSVRTRRVLRSGVLLCCVAAWAASCGSGGADSEVEESIADGATSSVDATVGTFDGTNPTTTLPPSVSSDAPDTVAGVQPEGFTTVTARVTAADGEVCEVCLWLADSDEERGRGLMGVTDLGDAAGMAFVFDPATTGSFYMFQTPTPLSIAWFGEDGAWVGAADMEPCLDATSERCALYSPGGAAYTVGVETFVGGLEPLLLVEGSTIELVEGTEALECQTPSS